jgi:hypothetical protein
MDSHGLEKWMSRGDSDVAWGSHRSDGMVLVEEATSVEKTRGSI